MNGAADDLPELNGEVEFSKKSGWDKSLLLSGTPPVHKGGTGEAKNRSGGKKASMLEENILTLAREQHSLLHHKVCGESQK